MEKRGGNEFKGGHFMVFDGAPPPEVIFGTTWRFMVVLGINEMKESCLSECKKNEMGSELFLPFSLTLMSFKPEHKSFYFTAPFTSLLHPHFIKLKQKSHNWASVMGLRPKH